MGTESVGSEATDDQVEAMARLLHEALDAGGLGFSTTLSFTHSDGDGEPVPSRWASRDEVLALCGAVRDHEGTTLEYVTDGCLRGFRPDEVELMGDMTLAGASAAQLERADDRLEGARALPRAARGQRGGRGARRAVPSRSRCPCSSR